MSLITEFKEFVSKGNVLELAVAVVIGAAFGKIVASFVADVLTPPLGLLLGNVDFSALKFVIGGKPDAPVAINYGKFIQAIFDFLVVAFSIFMLVKGVNSLHRKEEKKEEAAGPSNEEVLLAEIRDLLKSRT